MELITGEDTGSTEAVTGVHLSQHAAGERMSVQKFRIEPGQEVPSHSHPHEQAGYLVRGELTFVLGEDTNEDTDDDTDKDTDDEFDKDTDDESDKDTDDESDKDTDDESDDGSELVVRGGDSYVIPGGESHGVYNDGDEPAVGIDVFSPPRTDPDWKE